MSGKIIGSVEHYIPTGITSGSCKMAFVSAFKFLHTLGPQVGVQLIAWNYGTQPVGTRAAWAGNVPDYYDQPNTAGENAWACFRFTSASYPFDVFMQWGFTAAWSDILYLNAGTAQAQMGFSMCARTDGGNPWNGSTSAGGLDTKGTPLFVTGSSPGLHYPISNDPSITAAIHGATGRNIVGTDSSTNNDARYHYVGDKDGFLVLWDEGADSVYEGMYMGSYSPFECGNINPPLPIVVFKGNVPWSPATQYGTPAGTGANQGAIALPSGSFSGSCPVTNDRLDILFANNLAQPSHAYPTPAYNEMPIAIGAISSSVGANAWRAFLGYIDTPLCRETYNVPFHDTNQNGTRAVFGTTTLASIKFSIPFHSGTTPGAGLTQQGVQFTIP